MLRPTLKPIILTGLLGLSLAACGAPVSPAILYAGNVKDATAAPAIRISPTPMGAMSGMDMPTQPPAPTRDPNGALPTSDDFIAADLILGTKTPTGGAIVAAVPTNAPANAPTNAPVTSVPTNTPAVPATATHITTATSNVSAGPSGGAGSAGDAAKGKALFSGAPGCNACHDVSTGAIVVGPSLKGVASRAGTRKSGMSAYDYLHESIIKPNAFVVQGFAAGIMPQNFGQSLTEQQINDLIAYLLTLK